MLKAVPGAVLTAIISTLGIGILILSFTMHVFPAFFLFQLFLNMGLHNRPTDISTQLYIQDSGLDD